MIFADAMELRLDIRAGRIEQKDIFSLGMIQPPPRPGASLAMRPPDPVEVFAAFEAGDYEEFQKRIAALPSTQQLRAVRPRHPFCEPGGLDRIVAPEYNPEVAVWPVWINVDPRHLEAAARRAVSK